jgi:hypothetical protein
MKKTVLLMVCMLILSTGVRSQDKWLFYPLLGVEMGATIPFPFSDIPEGSKFSPRVSLVFGGGAEYKLNEKWHVGLELSYHQLGFSAKADVRSQSFYFDNHQDVLYFSGATDTRIELRMMELPIMARYKISKKSSFMIGIVYCFILDGTFDTRGSNGVLSDDKNITDNAALPGPANTRYNFDDFIENWDFGVQLGYRHCLNEKVFLWSNLKAGFNSIFKDDFDNIDYEMYQVRINLGASVFLF